jgi:hypothetical protein
MFIADAQRAGCLRVDFTPEDFLLLLSSNSSIVRETGKSWRRGISFMLDGLRTDRAQL